MLWTSKIAPEQQDPYQNEWNDLWTPSATTSLTTKPNAGAEASLVTSMGRMAAHTGQEITYEDILNGEHEFAPTVDQLTMDSPAPVPAGPDGTYPKAHARHHQEAGILNRLNTQFSHFP